MIPDKKIRCGAGCPVPWINEKDEENRRTGRKERKGRNETGKVIYIGIGMSVGSCDIVR